MGIFSIFYLIVRANKKEAMGIADTVVSEIFGRGKDLPKVLTEAIKHELGVSIGEFSEKSGIPVSTLYKILAGERDPNLRTFRKIITTIREIEIGSAEKRRFIAVVCSRGCLDVLDRRKISIGEESFDIREYAVTTMEEAIIAAIQAEREGASALVCAPIVSPTVERIVNIPVATIRPRTSIMLAIELAAKKIC